MFDRAEHGPALGITLFEPAKPTLDLACVLESTAGHDAAQSAQRAVQTRELTSQHGRLLPGSLEAACQDEGLCAI